MLVSLVARVYLVCLVYLVSKEPESLGLEASPS